MRVGRFFNGMISKKQELLHARQLIRTPSTSDDDCEDLRRFVSLLHPGGSAFQLAKKGSKKA